MEAQPVGIGLALAAGRREETLRCRVGADHQRDVAESGEDARARDVDRLGAGRAGAVGARHLRAVPAECLRDGRARDVAGIAVAHRVAAGDELDVGPFESRVGQRRARGVHAVLDEVPPPLAPRMHADAQHCNFLSHDTLLARPDHDS